MIWTRLTMKILVKVHVFWEGHKNFCPMQCQSKVRWRFRKILWPSQNIWTLNDQTKTCQNASFCTCPSDCICQRIGTFAFSRSTKTNARLINNTSNQGHSREKVWFVVSVDFKKSMFPNLLHRKGIIAPNFCFMS